MSKWPKQLPILNDKEKRIHDDFMKYWHEIVPKTYKIAEVFNHSFPIKNCKAGGQVLEIGSGLGEHISYENLNDTEYYAMELRPELAEKIKERYSKVRVIIGDCQKPLPFIEQFFDRVIAVHVLEHLPDLPSALKEVYRVLKSNGEFCVVIPCEGGFAHSCARHISAKRIFEKRYGISFNKFHKREHINNAKEIIEELNNCFKITKKSFFPFIIPSINLNIFIGMILLKKHI